ncbi:MAG: cyclic nucleotide-binding domain-containing protein [Planctomycetes bacterium]|nr:cyclic nucleotide-binding domain-containing protein [Planctomycetota bacterium]
MPIDTTIMEPRPGSGDRSIPKSVSYEQIVQLAPFAGITARIFENARMFKPGMMVLRVYQRGETIIRQLDAGNSAFYILTEAEQERLGFAVEGAPRDPDCDLADVFVLDVEVRPVQRRPKLFGLLATIQQRPRRAPDRESAPQKRVATLQAGEIVGEMSCLRHTPRSATICATAPLVALEMLRNVFEKVNNNRKNDEFRQRLERVYAKRAIYSHLENSPMLQGVGAEMLRDLQNKVKLVVKKPGDIIIKVGEPITEELDSGEIARGAYLISLGQVRIIQERPGGDQIVAIRRRGDIIGEISLVLGTPPNATCIAYEHPTLKQRQFPGRNETELIFVPKASFDALMESVPAFKKRIDDLIEERIKPPALPDLLEDTFSYGGAREFHELGLPQGQKLMVIDLERCTRCDECVRACAATHADGRTRLIREGPRFGHYLIPATCRQCRDPVCVIGCPVASIHTGAGGEIVIEDWCIGCKKCAQTCPYDAINMYERPESETAGETEKVAELAVACDQCQSLTDGEPSCVYSCPHEAAIRKDVNELFPIHGGGAASSMAGT